MRNFGTRLENKKKMIPLEVVSWCDHPFARAPTWHAYLYIYIHTLTYNVYVYTYLYYFICSIYTYINIISIFIVLYYVYI